MTPSGQTRRLATIVGTEAPAIRRLDAVVVVVVEIGSPGGSPAAMPGPA